MDPDYASHDYLEEYRTAYRARREENDRLREQLKAEKDANVVLAEANVGLLAKIERMQTHLLAIGAMSAQALQEK